MGKLHFEHVTDNRGDWFNHATQQYEHIETPTDFTNYLRQDPAVQDLYRYYIRSGDTPAEAAFKVLIAFVGEVRE